jgi:hypothetical protein
MCPPIFLSVCLLQPLLWIGLNRSAKILLGVSASNCVTDDYSGPVVGYAKQY